MEKQKKKKMQLGNHNHVLQHAGNKLNTIISFILIAIVVSMLFMLLLARHCNLWGGFSNGGTADFLFKIYFLLLNKKVTSSKHPQRVDK
jgi:hypothetical protein